MLQIKQVTDKPCFQCGNRQETADVKFKDGTFSGVLCKTHLWEAMKRNGQTVEGQRAAREAVAEQE